MDRTSTKFSKIEKHKLKKGKLKGVGNTSKLSEAHQIYSGDEETSVRKNKMDGTSTKFSKRETHELKKRKLKEVGNTSRLSEANQICSNDEDTSVRKSKMAKSATKISKSEKLKLKRRKLKKEESIATLCEAEHICSGDEDISIRTENTSQPEDAIDMIKSGKPQSTPSVRKSRGKKAGKRKKKLVPEREQTAEENKPGHEVGQVDEISLVDEDCSRGMKKWISEYYQNRPGVKILQQKIDDFITAHEVKEEQAKKEKEALAEEGGWTVVVHHKGRKKTTDSEGGTTVGSISQGAVTEKMAKKKSKEFALDFYRFQRREAKRNEILILQTKFEQDKKRIQELRAARKFRPY